MLIVWDQQERLRRDLGSSAMRNSAGQAGICPPSCTLQRSLISARRRRRCIAAHSRPNEQNLFAIVQGGLDPALRAISIRDLVARDTPGYAIGGLAGGESKDAFWRMVAISAAGEPVRGRG